MTEYEYEYYSVWKNHPNTNTNIIRFEKITRIRIRILFGLKISTEYEYEYFGIRIIFEYRIIRSPLAPKSQIYKLAMVTCVKTSWESPRMIENHFNHCRSLEISYNIDKPLFWIEKKKKKFRYEKTTSKIFFLKKNNLRLALLQQFLSALTKVAPGGEISDVHNMFHTYNGKKSPL